MIYKPCSYTNCPNLIPKGERYCNEHKNIHKQTKQIDEEYDSFYNTVEWRTLRQQALQRDFYLCQRCFKKYNTITPAQTVHHIIPIKVDYNKRNDINNLICLCESCHQIIHTKITS